MIERNGNDRMDCAEEALLAEARILLRSGDPESEAESNAHRAALATVERRLVSIHATASRPEEVARFLALLADKQRHFADAVKYWNAVKQWHQSQLDEANFKLGSAFLRLGDLSNAKRYVQAVSQSCSDDEKFKKLREQIKVRGSIEESIEAAEKVVLLAGEKCTPETAYQLLERSLATSRLSYRKDARIRSLLAGAFDAFAGITAVPALEPGDQLANYQWLRKSSEVGSVAPKLIFTSGFLWSGSGAVTAMLQGCSRVEVAVGGREISLFQHTHTMPGLLDSPLGSLNAAKLMKLLLAAVAGLLVDRKKVGVNRDKSLLKAQLDSGGKIDSVLEAGELLISHVKAHKLLAGLEMHRALLRSLCDFAVSAVQGLKSADDSILVMNNSIFAFHVRQLSIFADAMAVTVSRDPRDQYVAQFYERSRADVPAVDAFIKDTTRRYAHHARAMQELGLSDRVVDIRFEDFVSDESTRLHVLQKLGFKRAYRMGANGGFDPTKSSRNIGIYKSFPDKAVIAKIERAFPDRLYKP